MGRPTTLTFRYNIVASIIGNSLEWFDFALFGYIAPLFTLFFLHNEVANTASIYSLFFLYFIGLLGRPIGGVFFSFFGDTLGRRFVLLISIAIMACGAIFIALLPAPDSGGIYASIILLFAIALHNLSAGGENPAVVSFLIESSPPSQHTFAASWIYFGVFSGIFIGTVDFASLFWELGPERFAKWGWRVPFVLSATFGLCGFFLRKKLHESPAFEKKIHAHQIEKNPLVVVLKEHKKSILKGLCISVVDPVLVHSLIIFTPTYMQYFLKKSATESLTINIFSLLLCIIVIPFTGIAAQKIGAIRFLKMASFLLLILAYPLYLLIATASMGNILLAQGCLCLLCCSLVGPLPATVSLLFPTTVRCSGYALCHNIPVAIFGGAAPLLLSKGIVQTGMLTFPALYIALGALISFLSLLTLKDKTQAL